MAGKKIRMSILLIVTVNLTISNCDLTRRDASLKEIDEQEEAATYIPFIMNLISPRKKLTLKEKLSISQNVYNAFRKQKIIHDSQNEKNLNRNKVHLDKTFSMNKPYYLRF